MNDKKKECQKNITNFIRFGSYAPREYIINPDKKIIYLNNSKVACTSIKISLFDFHMKDEENIHLVLRACSKFKIDDCCQNYFKFTYVRNPFERLVSCYKDKVVNFPDYYKNYLGGYLFKNKDFEEFVNKVVLIPDVLADRHFQSQYFLVYCNGKPLVDYIGKIENINKTYIKLIQKYMLAPLNHYNSTEKNNWMDYYSFKTATKVYKYYKKDFIKFGYVHVYKELLNYLYNKK